MKAPVLYLSKFVTDPDAAMLALQNDLDWVRHDDAPRSEYYCNDTNEPYTYGRGPGVRTYEVQPWHPMILAIRKQLEQVVEADMDVCFLNRYLGPRDHLGWHSDDSPEMDPDRPIATVSLGAVRDIQFRPIDRSTDNEPLTLENGSCAIMASGMQQGWEHRIPKVGYNVEERISLTFRGYKKLRKECVESK